MMNYGPGFIISQQILPEQFIVGRPVHFAVSPPDGRRFVTRFAPRVLREQLHITKQDSIAIALDNNWLVADAVLRLTGILWVNLRFKPEALAVEKVYRAGQLFLKDLADIYPCFVTFKPITTDPNLQAIVTTRSINFSHLQLFHYYNTYSR